MLQGTVFALLNRDGLLADAGSVFVLESSEDDKAFFFFFQVNNKSVNEDFMMMSQENKFKQSRTLM